MKLNEKNNRTSYASLRLNEQEYAQLEQMKDMLGIGKSEIMRLSFDLFSKMTLEEIDFIKRMSSSTGLSPHQVICFLVKLQIERGAN